MDTSIDQILATKGYVVHQVVPQMSVRDAVALMNQHNIGALLVTSEGRLLGIFTERDVLQRVVGAGRDPVTTSVADVMTRSLITLRRSHTLHEALRIVDAKRCRHLPVIEGGELVGLVSIGDLTRFTIRTLESDVVELSRYIGSPFPA